MARTHDTMSMTTLYVADKSIDELECLFTCDVQDDDFYMVIAYNIALTAPGFLQANIRTYSGRRLRGALFGLGFVQGPDDEVAALLVTYLDCDDEFAAAEAIESLGARRYDRIQAQIAQMDKHTSPYVRGAVLRYLRFIRGSDSFEILVDNLEDDHFIVRQNAIDELAELGDTRAISHIRRLTADTHPDVRRAAAAALEELGSVPN